MSLTLQGGVHGFIQMTILFIIFLFSWMIGRLFVLPHMSVGIPALPPYPVSQAIYNEIFKYSVIAFGIFGGVTAVLWIIYFYFTYKRRWIFIIPVYKIIRSVTPIKQFIECGLFPMLDRIYFLWDWKKRISLKDRIFGTVNALAAFLAKSIRYIVIKATGRDPYNPKPSATVRKPTLTVDVGDMSVGKYDPKKKDLLTQENAEKQLQEKAGVTVTTKSVTSGSDAFNTAARDPSNQFEEKIDDVEINENPKLTVDERKYIHSEYNNCMAESYVPYDESLPPLEKVSVRIANVNAQVKCNLTKFQAYSKMFDSLFDR